ncbi:MAG: AsmA family protein [Rhizobiaceae bacterium]
MKKTLISTLVLALIVVALAMTLPSILTSAAMRDEMAKRISQASGMQASLNGPVNLSVFPDLGLVAEQVVLQAPDGSMEIRAAKIVAGVSLFSLLSSQIEITKIGLVQPEFTLVETIGAGGGNSPANSVDGANSDPLKAAITLLEGVSLSGVSVRNGKLSSQALSGATSVITNIDASLNATNLDEEVEIALSAVQDGRKVTLEASVAALRPILQQQPAGIDIALQMTPAPHPALADIRASGTVKLEDDGSYRIADGRFFVLDQPLKLDAIYRPGERPAAIARMSADLVDLGLFANSTESEKPASKPATAASKLSEPIDLSALMDIDVDVDMAVKSLLMNGVEIRDIRLAGLLDAGSLNVELAQANGNFGAEISSNLGEKNPTFRGNLQANSLQIAALNRIANVEIPADGALSVNLGYAFRGTDEQSIRNSLNVAGNIKLSDGKLSVPALRDAGLGPSADQVSGLNVRADIKDISQPVSLAGNLTWMKEGLSFDGSLSPLNFLAANSGPVRLSVDSRRVNASYDGSVSLDGRLRGNARIATSSLGGLLGWLGQGDNTNLKDFSYAGDISVSDKAFSFSNSNIVLNGMNASGSGEVALAGKTSINTNLAFNTLNLEALTGGSSGAGNSSRSANPGAATPIDLSALRSIDANIRISAQKLGFGKVNAGPVNTSLVIKNGVARLQIPQTPFYQGSVLADIEADGSKDVPAIKLNAKLTNIRALPLFQDAADFKRIEGRLNADINTSGTGKTTSQFASSLNGNAVAKFSDGAIIGVDIANIYNNLSSVLTGGFKENSSDKTKFTEMGLSFKINQGIATTNDIKLLGPLVRMDGAGTVDLGKETIDMRLNPQLVGSPTGQGGEFDVAGVGIPLIVQGALASPRVYPDLSGILQNPTGALQTLSKLGLGIQGLGGGNLNLENLALGNNGDGGLKLDNLNLGETGNLVGKSVEGLIGGNNNNESGTGNLVGSLLNKFANPQNRDQAGETTGSPAPSGSPVPGGSPLASGRIPIPTPNPRRPGSVQSGLNIGSPTSNPTVENIAEDLLRPNNSTDGEPASGNLENLLKKVLP